MKVASVLNDVLGTLNDPDARSWTHAELLGWLTQGVNQVLAQHPDQNTKVAAVTAVAGAKQSIPSDGFSIISVLDNGSGREPRKVDPVALGAFDVSWRTAAPAPAREWAPDRVDPRVFWLNPPAAGGESLSVEYAALIASLSMADELPIDDRFVAPLHDYVVSMAKAKDSHVAADAAMADMHRKRFMEAISG